MAFVPAVPIVDGSVATALEANVLNPKFAEVAAYADTLDTTAASYLPGNVMRYGAIGDGAAHPLSERYGSLGAAQAVYPFVTALTQQIDWAAGQKLVNELADVAAPSAGEGYWPPGVYMHGGDSIQIPGTSYSEVFQWCRLIGANAKIMVTGTTPVFDRHVTTWTTYTDASSAANRIRYVFQGFRFYGTNPGAQQYGIRFCGAQNIAIRDCQFYNMDGATDLIFTFGSTVENCLSNGMTSFGHRARDAVTVLTEASWSWTGAVTEANTAPNYTTYWKCRDYCATGQFASFWVETGYGCVIRECISEGANPNHNVFFDPHSNGRQFSIETLHSENAPTVSLIKLKSFNHVSIDRLHIGATAAGKTIIDGSGSTVNSRIHFRGTGYWPTSAILRNGTTAFNTYWIIENVGPAQDFTAAAMWDLTASGTQPSLIYQLRSAIAAEDSSGYPTIAGKRLNISATDDLRLHGATGVRVGYDEATAFRGIRAGTATGTGTGAQTAFTIAHGLETNADVAAAPTGWHVEANNSASADKFWTTVDTTNITVTYAAAPANAAALVWKWWCWR